MTQENNNSDVNTAPKPRSKPRSRLVRKGRGWRGVLMRATGTLALIVLSMIVSAALGLAWLTSEDGRAFVASQAEDLASNDHMTLALGPITRLGLRHLDIETITISDKDGLALEVRELSLTFDTAALLAGKIHVNELKTAAITFNHPPDTGAPTHKTDAPEPFKMPVLAVDSFALNNIYIAAAGPREATQFNAGGSLRLSPILSKSMLSMDIEASADKTRFAHLRIKPTGDEGMVEIAAEIMDDGTGPLSALSGTDHINVRIDGAGPANDWRGMAEIDIAPAWQAQGRLDVRMSNDAAMLNLTGKSTAGGVTTTGEHRLTWRSASGRTVFSFTGQADTGQGERGNQHIPELALKATLAPQPTGGMDASLTALASKVKPVLNSKAALALNARIRGKKITVENSYLQALGERIDLAGQVDTAKQNLDFDITSRIAALKKLDPRLGGTARADIHIGGNYANELRLLMQGQIGAEKLTTPWAQATDMLGPAPKLAVEAGINGSTIRLDRLKLTGADNREVTASGQMQDSAGSFTISGGLAHYGLNGDITIAPAGVKTDNLQLTGPFGAIDARLTTQTEDADISGALTWRRNFENTADISFKKNGQDIDFEGNVVGTSLREYKLDFAGHTQLGAKLRAELAKLDGHFGSNKISLPEPLVISSDDDGTQLEDTVLKINDGRISLGGNFGEQKFSAQIRADALPANMDIFPLLFDGTIDGTVDVSGPYAAPVGKAVLSLNRIRLPAPVTDTDKAQDRFVNGDITVDLGNNRATFTTALSGTAGLRFNAEGDLPVSFSPAGIPADKPMNATIDAYTDLRAVTLLLGLDAHRLGGAATLDMAISGTLNAPQVSGTGQLSDGRYENLLTGTVLRNITSRIRAENTRLILEQLEGTDRNSGGFTGTGQVSFKTLQQPEYDLQLSADKLNIISLDRLGLTVSGGLESAGDSQQAEITGDVTIDNAEYYITKSLGGDALSDFEVVETGKGLSVQTADAPPAPSGPAVQLDIGLKAEHSIYVRGPDLESEWGADLYIGGTMREPAMEGDISLVRGQYRVLETTIRMKEGTIGFTPSDMKDPALDLKGELKGHGETAILNVTGTAKAPEVALTSESGLQDDELLAQVLFGKSLSELTPVQALRVARLMAYLTGHGGSGFDPLGAIRRAIGVDALSVGMDEEGGATLSVDKYVTDKIYLSVDQGATPESSAVRVEIEVTDEIEVESSASGTQENTLGVNWKRDY